MSKTHTPPHQNSKDEFGLLIKLVFFMGMAQVLVNSSLFRKIGFVLINASDGL